MISPLSHIAEKKNLNFPLFSFHFSNHNSISLYIYFTIYENTMHFYVIRNSISDNVKKPLLNSSGLLLAGLGGFEPPDAGVRIQCLTAWR